MITDICSIKSSDFLVHFNSFFTKYIPVVDYKVLLYRKDISFVYKTDNKQTLGMII